MDAAGVLHQADVSAIGSGRSRDTVAPVANVSCAWH